MLDLLGGLYTTDRTSIAGLSESKFQTHVVGLLLSLLGTTTEAEDKVKSRLLLDVIVAQCASILELLAGEDEALLVWGNAVKEMSFHDPREC